MKAFSSSILNEKNYTPDLIKESTSFEKMKDTSESAIIRMLQFNEASAEADIASTREYFISLLKMTNSTTNNYDPAYAAIFNRYDAVIHAASALIDSAYKGYTETNYGEIGEKFRHIAASVDTTIPMVCGGNVKTPSNIQYDVLLFNLRDYCIKGIESMKNGSFNEWADAAERIDAKICSYVARAIGIEHSETIEDFIQHYNDAFSYSTTDIHVHNVPSIMYEGMNRLDQAYNYLNSRDISDYAMTDSFISIMKIHSGTNTDPNKVRKVVDVICNAISTYAIIIAKSRDIIDKHREHIRDVNMASMVSFINNNMPVREAMTIFGDEITTKSLFDDLDPEDFNPTEFMDLTLVAEHVLTMDRMEAKKYAMAVEAHLLATGQYDKLYQVDEAMAQKIKDGVHRFVEAVKKIIDKFVADIMYIFAPEKKYLEKYKNIILNHTIPEGTEVTFEGDVIAAYQRLNNNDFKIPTIAYNELIGQTHAKNQFENEETFFEMHKNDFGNLSGFNRNNENSLADDLKVFWGFKDGKTHQHTFADLNKHIPKIYQWLLDTAKDAKKLQIESKNIDRTYKNYLASAKQYGKPAPTADGAQQQVQNKVTNQPSNTNQQQTAQNASYYSAIFDKIISEADFGEIQNSKPEAPANDNKQNNDQGNTKTRTDMTRGDTDAEVKKSGQEESEIARNMEIYVKVCQAVITARITGLRYVHKELMSVMQFIVKAKLGNKATIRNDADSQQAKENTPEPKKEAPKENTQSKSNTRSDKRRRFRR